MPLADLTTTTTHKTLRGPRGGMILAARASPLTERVDAAVFPGTQGGPLMHVIAAKAVAFAEALEPEFKAYQRQTLANARLLAAGLIERGYPVLTGGTDNHMLLVDLRAAAIDAVRAERALHAAHIAVNRASLPGETGDEPTAGQGRLCGSARRPSRRGASASPRPARSPAGSPTSSTRPAATRPSPPRARKCSICAPSSPSTAHNSERRKSRCAVGEVVT